MPRIPSCLIAFLALVSVTGAQTEAPPDSSRVEPKPAGNEVPQSTGLDSGTRKFDTENLTLIRKPNGRLILTNNPERYAKREGYSIVTTDGGEPVHVREPEPHSQRPRVMRHDPKRDRTVNKPIDAKFLIHFNSDHVQAVEDLTEEEKHYIVKYRSRTFRVKKSKVREIVDLTKPESKSKESDDSKT